METWRYFRLVISIGVIFCTHIWFLLCYGLSAQLTGNSILNDATLENNIWICTQARTLVRMHIEPLGLLLWVYFGIVVLMFIALKRMNHSNVLKCFMVITIFNVIVSLGVVCYALLFSNWTVCNKYLVAYFYDKMTQIPLRYINITVRETIVSFYETMLYYLLSFTCFLQAAYQIRKHEK